MSWESLRDISYRTRNMIRRGYLLSTDASGKLLRGRVKTGKGIENDELDIVQPVGFHSRLPAGPKVEVITVDVNGDASKRVVLAVIGDREMHPKVDEGEAVLYSPGDPKKKLSVHKTNGVNLDADDTPIALSTKKKLQMTAEEGASLFDTVDIDKDGNVTIRGNLRVLKDLRVEGNITVGGNVVVEGTVTAAGFINA